MRSERACFFKGTDRVLILDAINQRLRHSKLAGMIAFDLEGDMVLLTIKKLGKSTIYLSSERERDGLLFRVAREDVRAHHQVLRPLVLKELESVLQGAGGTLR